LTWLEVSKPLSRTLKYTYQFKPVGSVNTFIVTYTAYRSPSDIRDGLDLKHGNGWKVTVEPVTSSILGTLPPVPTQGSTKWPDTSP
jgi:expansin (peptidoglycan-binding protein)